MLTLITTNMTEKDVKPINLSILIFILGVPLCFSGCLKTPDFTSPKASRSTEDVLKRLITSGGQPGEIILNGKCVKAEGVLDDRISLEQTVGDSDQPAEIYEPNKPKLNPNIKRKENYTPSRFETYLNIGCDLKDSLDIQGMKEAKIKQNDLRTTDIFGSVSSSVDKVFICGKVDVKEAFVNINANEVFLNNAEISMINGMQSIFSLASDRLSIEGANLISTTGISNGVFSFMDAPAIKISVFEKIIGTGNLKLNSKGGDYRQSTK
jgi:hypothetical protein